MAINEPTSAAPSVRRGGKSATAFRTISEVAGELDVPQHVLRFWETKFSHIKPLKRGGGRRYYRPEDVALLNRIRDLLYRDGYTIRGVQRLFRENGVRSVLRDGAPANAEAPAGSVQAAQGPATEAAASSGGLSSEHRVELRTILDELGELRALLGKELD